MTTNCSGVHSFFRNTTDSFTPMTFTSEEDIASTTVSAPGLSFRDLVESLADSEASRQVWKFCPPVILLLGTFGSVMTFWVLSKCNMGSSALLVYFKALAVSDLCLLYSGLLRHWIKFVFYFEIRDVHAAVCKVHIFTVYVSGMASAWFLVAMTSQRAVSVAWPHRIQTLCTRRSSRLIVILIVTFSSLLNAHNLYGYTLKYSAIDGKSTCDYADLQYEDFARGPWPWIDLTFSSLLPFFLVIVSNILMIWKVSESVRKVKLMTSHTNLDVVTQRKRESTSLTLTLVCLSALFLLLNSPLCAYLVSDFYMRSELDSNPQLAATAELAWAVTNTLWYTNSAINFYLYCLSGSRFRSQVLRTLCCGRGPTAAADRTPGRSGVLRTITAALAVSPHRKTTVLHAESLSEF